MIYNPLKNLQLQANSFIGGNVVAIVARQAMIAKAMGRAFIAKNRALLTSVQPISNPVFWLAGVPVTTRMQETYTYQADVTDHAVESGVLFADHVILQPLRVDITAEVSNWSAGTAKFALDLFETMHQERMLVDLITEHKQLSSMCLIALHAGTAAPQWGKLVLQLSFRQIRLVTLEATPYVGTPSTTATEETGGPDVGYSANEESTEGQQTPKDASTAVKWFDSWSS